VSQLKPVPMLPIGADEDTLRAWAEDVEAAAKAREADGHFQAIGLPDGVGALAAVCYSRCCTDLPDAEAVERMNLVPSGTRHGWQLVTEDRDGQPVWPVACDEKPGFRHLLFEC
jgi:hypothetical protein